MKPVFIAKTDFIDDLRLLILRNLLKTRMGPKIPGYRNVGYKLAFIGLYEFGRARPQK
jgi:hypothetical protein